MGAGGYAGGLLYDWTAAACHPSRCPLQPLLHLPSVCARRDDELPLRMSSPFIAAGQSLGSGADGFPRFLGLSSQAVGACLWTSTISVQSASFSCCSMQTEPLFRGFL